MASEVRVAQQAQPVIEGQRDPPDLQDRQVHLDHRVSLENEVYQDQRVWTAHQDPMDQPEGLVYQANGDPPDQQAPLVMQASQVNVVVMDSLGNGETSACRETLAHRDPPDPQVPEETPGDPERRVRRAHEDLTEHQVGSDINSM